MNRFGYRKSEIMKEQGRDDREIAVRLRVHSETDGRCQRCGDVARNVVGAVSKTALLYLCNPCTGAIGAEIKTRMKEARQKQVALFK